MNRVTCHVSYLSFSALLLLTFRDANAEAVIDWTCTVLLVNGCESFAQVSN